MAGKELTNGQKRFVGCLGSIPLCHPSGLNVRNAIARFKQVQGVTEAERDEAWKRIKSAANKHKVELNEQDWRKLS